MEGSVTISLQYQMENILWTLRLPFHATMDTGDLEIKQGNVRYQGIGHLQTLQDALEVTE